MTSVTINVNEKVVSRTLLALAALLPILFALVSPKLSGDMGYISGKVASYMAIGVIILHAIIRKKPEAIQNRVILVFGAYMLCYSLYSVFDIWNQIRQSKEALSNLIETTEDANKKIQASNAQAFNRGVSSPESLAQPVNNSAKKITVAELVNGLQPLVKKFMDKNVDLNSRMNTIPFDAVLAPANLIRAHGIQQSRLHLNQFKAVIVERNDNLSQYLKDAENYFRNANIDEGNKKNALEGFLNGKPNLERLYRELDGAQLGLINESLAILEICEQNMGEVTIGNNQLLFPNQALLDAYNNHLNNVVAYAQKETEVFKELEVQSKQTIAENKKILDEM